MNPALVIQLLELLVKLGPVLTSVVNAVSQVQSTLTLVKTLQDENRDPTPEELASLDAAFAQAHSALDDAIAAKAM